MSKSTTASRIHIKPTVARLMGFTPASVLALHTSRSALWPSQRFMPFGAICTLGLVEGRKNLREPTKFYLLPSTCTQLFSQRVPITTRQWFQYFIIIMHPEQIEDLNPYLAIHSISSCHSIFFIRSGGNQFIIDLSKSSHGYHKFALESGIGSDNVYTNLCFDANAVDIGHCEERLSKRKQQPITIWHLVILHRQSVGRLWCLSCLLYQLLKYFVDLI